MTDSTIDALSPAEKSKLISLNNFRDSFKNESLELFEFLGSDISSHLKDHFSLVNDFQSTLNEENRRVYYDYGFIVLPVHKALECYLKNVFDKIFNLKVSKKRDETVGFYLNLPDDKKKKHINDLAERVKLETINSQNWLKGWNSLKDEWSDNRNPLTHFDGERIETLKQAEQISAAIIRQLDLTSQTITKELFNPLLEVIKKEKEAKDKDSSLVNQS